MIFWLTILCEANIETLASSHIQNLRKTKNRQIKKIKIKIFVWIYSIFFVNIRDLQFLLVVKNTEQC